MVYHFGNPGGMGLSWICSRCGPKKHLACQRLLALNLPSVLLERGPHVLPEEVEHRGNVVVGRRVRELRHLPPADHGHVSSVPGGGERRTGELRGGVVRAVTVSKYLKK